MSRSSVFIFAVRNLLSEGTEKKLQRFWENLPRFFEKLRRFLRKLRGKLQKSREEMENCRLVMACFRDLIVR